MELWDLVILTAFKDVIYKIVAMEAAKEGEFELFSLFIFCGVPTLEIMRKSCSRLRLEQL